MGSKFNNITSVKYHEIFDYNLTKEEITKWQYKNEKVDVSKARHLSMVKNKGRIQRERYSKNKLIIAKKASSLISKISTVNFVGVTGSLAMMNADRDSDIDLMIITRHGCLWITRLFVYIVLKIETQLHHDNFKLRIPSNKNERNALCINLWLDESDLIWDKKDRNIYTAHEIAQVVPLVNKTNTYEKFLYLNRWILEFWPKAVKILRYKQSLPLYGRNMELKVKTQKNLIRLLFYYAISILEVFAFKLQYFYMKSKITREVVTPTRAIFHPNDWGKKVMLKLKTID